MSLVAIDRFKIHCVELYLYVFVNVEEQEKAGLSCVFPTAERTHFTSVSSLKPEWGSPDRAIKQISLSGGQAHC